MNFLKSFFINSFWDDSTLNFWILSMKNLILCGIVIVFLSELMIITDRRGFVMKVSFWCFILWDNFKVFFVVKFHLIFFNVSFGNILHFDCLRFLFRYVDSANIINRRDINILTHSDTKSTWLSFLNWMTCLLNT